MIVRSSCNLEVPCSKLQLYFFFLHLISIKFCLYLFLCLLLQLNTFCFFIRVWFYLLACLLYEYRNTSRLMPLTCLHVAYMSKRPVQPSPSHTHTNTQAQLVLVHFSPPSPQHQIPQFTHLLKWIVPLNQLARTLRVTKGASFLTSTVDESLFLYKFMSINQR